MPRMVYDYVSTLNTCITVSCMKYIDDKMIDLNKGKAPEKYKIQKKRKWRNDDK